ncbi:MAG: hypothetical protein KAJ49_03275, partial [Arcobacteraceae bacterium]|nr:hypothetical protein [Arcobacteraceae bacterium]
TYHDASGYTIKVDENNSFENNTSYCVETYGEGWRIPTIYEMGKTNNNNRDTAEASGLGYLPSYMGDTSTVIWTSSMYRNVALKLWITRSNDSLMRYKDKKEEAYIRCVYLP